MKAISTPMSSDAIQSDEIPFLTVTALMIYAAITPMILLIAPAVAAQLGTQLKLSPSQIGTYFFVELGAFSFASIPSYLWMHRLDARRVAAFSTALFVLGNLVTAMWLPGYEVLLVLRAVTALGGGTLMVLCMTTAATSTNRDRVYGFWVIGQLIAGTVGLFLLPKVFAPFGISAFYYLLVALAVCAAPLVRHFPDLLKEMPIRGGARPGQRDATMRWRFTAALAIASVFAFYMAIGGVWTFASSAATTAGLSPDGAGTILAIASIFGISGAALASWVGGSRKRDVMLCIGYSLLALSLVELWMQPKTIGYSVAVFMFKFGWTFVLPFVLAAVAQIDRSKKLIASLTLVIGAGLAIGPLVAGWMIEFIGDLHSVFACAIVLTVGSLAGLLWMAARGRHQ